MRNLSVSRSLLYFLDELEYTEAALVADPLTEDLSPAFREEIVDWDGVFLKERGARRGVTRSEAVVAVRDVQLDVTTMRFGGAALLEANQDRKSSFFRRFFTVAPSTFVRQALRKQCNKTLNVVLAEIEKLPAASTLKPFIDKLRGRAEAAIAALDARNQAKADRQLSSNDVDEWKEGINRLRLTTYAELLKIAAEKSYSKSWADTFFHEGSSSQAATEPAEPTLAEPTPAEPPAGS